MIERIFPKQLDNDYRGWRAGLWVFGLVLVMKGMQSVMIIFRGWPTVRDADGVPLESYPADAAQNVVTMFAQSSLWRLIVCLLGVVVLVRYRSAVALMFVVFIASYLGARVLSLWAPLIRVGSPPGTYVNLVGFAVMVVGLVLAVMRRERA